MRQSNQKSRSRGRGRKPQNPMSRNFESNGPDVKIRGNASHNRIVAAAQQQSEARAAEMAEKRQAEQDAAGENADANTEAEAKSNEALDATEDNSEAAPKERKNSRNRRPRKQPVAEASNGNGEEQTSDKSDEPSVEPEIISEDAAKLPGSLLGGMAAEES